MLKKIAILTAAAGMLSTSMAVLAEGPTVYGRVAFGLKNISGETDAVDSQRIDDHLGGRLGVKGSNDLGNGMSVDYLLEYQTNKNQGKEESKGLFLRHANMTLNGSFGQFRLGQQTGVLYRYTGSNSDQSWSVGGSEWYAIAANNMNSDHSLRMKNIAAYRFGAGPGGDDPITFDIQIQSVDMSKKAVAGKAAATEVAAVADTTDSTITRIRGTAAQAQMNDKPAMDDGESIDSVTIGAATSLGPVKLQLAYVDENGSKATDNKSPSLVSFGFRAPLGSAEIRGHLTEVDADDDMRDDNEAWGLLVMNDFGGGYFGMIGVGNYKDGGRAKAGSAVGVTRPAENLNLGANPVYQSPVHENAGDKTNVYVSLTKSFGGGLSAVAEYSTVTTTVSTDPTAHGTDVAADSVAGDDEEKTNTFLLSLVQSF